MSSLSSRLLAYTLLILLGTVRVLINCLLFLGSILMDTAGNCLFNALSDQLYGDQSCNTQLRDGTVEYMKNNPDRFKSFLVVHPGGGSRRNPKRKNHGSHATSAIPSGPTPQEIDAAYKQHMKTMAKTGVYGDNLEIIAFAQAFKVDIMIFSEGGRFFYYVRCEKAEGEMAPMLCIVHHVSNIPKRSGVETNHP